jgi:cyclohexyl-isocyanide hydratase
MNRRELTKMIALGAASALAQAQDGASKPPENIVMLVYPGMTALDLVGPQQVFGYLMGVRVHLIAKSKDVVVTDTGIGIRPSMTLSECPENVEVLFAPGGGQGTIAAMQDREILGFFRERGKTAKYVTSVCTGSLILGAAGLLRGYKATSHWSVRNELALFGAEPVARRVVEDRNRITAGGITSGIDFGLRLAARLRGEQYAQSLELTMEYDPQPPFHAGTPETAPKEVVAMMTKMYAPLVTSIRDIASRTEKPAGMDR